MGSLIETVVDLCRRVGDAKGVARLIAISLFVLVALPSVAQAQAGGMGSIRDAEGGRVDSDDTDTVQWSVPILWDQTVTVNTLSKDAQLTYDPHYIWWFTFRPRYQIRDDLWVGAQFGFSYEWTNSVDSDFNRPGFYGRQVLWQDVRLDTVYNLPWTPGGVQFQTTFNLRLPASKFSRSRERILSPGASFNVSKRFDVLKGLTLVGGANYWGWLAKSNVANLGFNDYPCQLAPGGGGPLLDDCVGESTAARHWVGTAASVVLEPVKKFRIGTGFTAFWAKGFPLAEACTTTLTGLVCLGDNSDNARWNTFTNFNFFVSYDITRYLTTALAYDTWGQQPDSDGDRENAFYNENTRLVLSFELRIEDIYTSVRKRRAKKRDSKALASTH